MTEQKAEHGVYNFIKEYLKKDIYPFHMPGHKRMPEYLPEGLLQMEITEFPGADNLLSPNGILLDLEKRFSKVYGSDESFIMTNGSTGCILAAVMAVRKQGAKVLIARNCHKSVYSALVLSGMRPVYLFPEITDNNLVGGINPSDVEVSLSKNSDIAAVIITSPTYEGFLSDISTISEIAHRYEVPLIVDEAHGANFAFSSELPASAVRCGADIVIHSLHKRLPMLSQTSLIHVNRGYIEPATVKKAFNLIQTTSPSYVFLAQMDYCLSKLTEEGNNIMAQYTKMIKEFREKAPKDGTLSLITKEFSGKNSIFDVDISKFVFYINSTGLSGGRLERIMAENYGVQIELSGVCHIIAMTSPADKEEGFGRLLNAVESINSGGIFVGEFEEMERIARAPRPKIVLTPRDAFYEKTKAVKLSESESMVSATFMIPYPPGIPLVAPGEIITSEILDYIKLCKESGINVIGADETILVCDGL